MLKEYNVSNGIFKMVYNKRVTLTVEKGVERPGGLTHKQYHLFNTFRARKTACGVLADLFGQRLQQSQRTAASPCLGI